MASNIEILYALATSGASAPLQMDASGNLKIAIAGMTASNVASTATGDVAATNVQGAIAELDTEKFPVAKVLTATAALDFPSIAAAASADLTVTVTNAAVNDGVILGLPAAPAAGLVFNGFVSAANTVTVRASNITAAPIDPASATYRVTVVRP